MVTRGEYIARRVLASSLRWLVRHWGAAKVARRLGCHPVTVRAACLRGEATPYLLRKWRADTPGAAWCRALVRGSKRGGEEARLQRREPRGG